MYSSSDLKRRAIHCNVSLSEATDDLSNDQDSVEVDYSKTNNNDICPVQDPITKLNDGNDTQKS